MSFSQMWSTSLTSLLLILLTAEAWTLEKTLNGTEEGEECHKEGNQVWTCKKDRECEALRDILKLNGRLRTCSWKGLRTHIICCPPQVTSDRQVLGTSEQKCMEYQNHLCEKTQILGPIYVTVRPDKRSSSLRRGKRQEFESTSSLATAGKLPVKADVLGRRRTKRQGSSIMVGEDEEEFHTTVFGGSPAKPRENPHMALIGYGNADAISWQCGGSLISETYVLSAAHCVNTGYGPARWVRLGDLDLSSDSEEAQPQQFQVIERVVHPGYRAPAFYNNLALLRLDRAALFDRFVRPACLYTDLKDPTGYGTAAGWGKNETSGPRSSSLLQVDLKYVPGEECKQTVGNIKTFLAEGLDTKTMICAGELGKDTCQGDSGGPLVISNTTNGKRCLATLVGVTSFGPRNCGRTSVPGAFVRVAYFTSWIESIVWPQ